MYFFGAVLFLLSLLVLVVDGIRLIQEKGYRENSHFYHTGDGTFAYHVNVELENSIYFKCVHHDDKVLRCRGRAILYRGGGFRLSKPHSHLPDPDFVALRHFRENVLEACEKDNFVSFQDILTSARQDRRYSRRVRQRMNMRRLRTPMYNARMKRFPPVPYSLRGLTRVLLNSPQLSKTVDGDEHLYAGSITATDGSHHIAFFSPRMLNFMKNIKFVQADGTFKSRPLAPHSAQVYALVTTWQHHVVPLGWFLMERKSLAAYQAVIHLLKNICPDFKPDVIMSDWEYSQQFAWQEAFPDAKMKGCLWHLSRAFVRKAKGLKLMRFRKDFPDLFTYIKQACAIALLPVEFFNVGLDMIKEKALEDDIVIAYLLRPFFTYVERNWINNNFRRNWMSLYESVERTNNSCESHNRMLRSAVGAYRPNVFVFIEALAKLEHNASLDAEYMGKGGQVVRTRRWTTILADDMLQAMARDLNGDLFHDLGETVHNYVSRAATLFHGAFEQHVEQAAGQGGQGEDGQGADA